MSTNEIDRMVLEFEHFCARNGRCDVDRLLSSIRAAIGVVLADPLTEDTYARRHALQTPERLEGYLRDAHRRESREASSIHDALFLYSEHFSVTPSSVVEFLGVHDQLSQQLVDSLCRNEVRKSSEKEIYILFLHTLSQVPRLAKQVVDHLVTCQERHVENQLGFPLPEILLRSVSYELAPALIAVQDRVVGMINGNPGVLTQVPLRAAIKAWGAGLKDVAKLVVEHSRTLPQGRDLVELKIEMGFTLDQTRQIRCWQSDHPEMVEAIIAYYLEYDDAVDFPLNHKHVPRSLFRGLIGYQNETAILVSEKYTAIVDYLIARTLDSEKDPLYKKLPKIALECSELYLESNFQSDLGL